MKQDEMMLRKYRDFEQVLQAKGMRPIDFEKKLPSKEATMFQQVRMNRNRMVHGLKPIPQKVETVLMWCGFLDELKARA